MRKKLVMAAAIAGMLCQMMTATPSAAAEKSLTQYQERNAERIAEAATKEYKKSGVLPSMAVAQALNESSLGVNSNSYNWWGIMKADGSDKIYCRSFSEGLDSYFDVINNGRYDGALFNMDWNETILEILEGGYYGGNRQSYYEDIRYLYRTYNLSQYDEKLFNRLEKEKEERKRRKEKAKAKRDRKESEEQKVLEAEQSQTAQVTDMVSILKPEPFANAKYQMFTYPYLLGMKPFSELRK